SGSIPSFDIILLGIGEDGHTASIFPNQMNLLTSDKLYDTAIQPKTGNTRITMTGTLINNAKNVNFLVSGKNKSIVINEIVRVTEPVDRYPAAMVEPLNGNLYWYLDKSAAGDIAK
ncbi:MAG TPA: 6-phosphogluconolactonase, partial [Ignavibacteria bacterium]|nr:6-phosphogluconolactonase [Ignavibacteria bacterium]